MYSKKKWITAAALVCSVLGSSASYAQSGDCRRVSFSFTNKWTVGSTPVDVRVQSVTINGSDGSWTENLSNQIITPNHRYTTRQRRLQQHEAGERASFTVNFEHRRIGAGWEGATHGPFEMLCQNGDTLGFTLMPPSEE